SCYTTPATTQIYTLSLHDALPICAFSTWRRTIGFGRATRRKFTTATWPGRVICSMRPVAPVSGSLSTPAAWQPWLCLAETIYPRSEEHTSELQSRGHRVCRLLPEK